MIDLSLADYHVDRRVDELFGSARYGELCQNPVTGASYLYGIDPIAPQKEAARRALLAREWFANNGPADLQPLPLSHAERESLKGGGAPHILAWYARSLVSRNYDVMEHPAFEDYARGVMAYDFTSRDIKEDSELQRRFPPQELPGMGPGLYWQPPKQ